MYVSMWALIFIVKREGRQGLDRRDTQPATTHSSGPGGRRTLLKLPAGPSRVRLPTAPLRRKLLSGSGCGGPGGHVEQECCRGMLFLQVGGSLL